MLSQWLRSAYLVFALAGVALLPSTALAMEAYEAARTVETTLGAEGTAKFVETTVVDVVYGPLDRMTFGGAPDAEATVVVRSHPSAVQGTASGEPVAATVTRSAGRDGNARFVVSFGKKGLRRGTYDVVMEWNLPLANLLKRTDTKVSIPLAGLLHERSVDGATFVVHAPDFGALPALGADEGFAAKPSVGREGGLVRVELTRAHLARGERFVAPLLFGRGAFPTVGALATSAEPAATEGLTGASANDANEDAQETEEVPALPKPTVHAAPVPLVARAFAALLPLAFAALIFFKFSGKCRDLMLMGPRTAAAVSALAFCAALFAFDRERDALASAFVALPLAALFLRRTTRDSVRAAGEWLAVRPDEASPQKSPLDPSTTLSRGLSLLVLVASAGLAMILARRDARLAAGVVLFSTPFLVALRALPDDLADSRLRHGDLLVAAHALLDSKLSVLRTTAPRFAFAVTGPSDPSCADNTVRPSGTILRPSLLARFPNGSSTWDDLRLRVSTRDLLPGLRSIEAGLLRDEDGAPVPLADVHVRVFEGSEAHDRLLARFGSRGFTPGRTPEERVLRLRVERPGAQAIAETLSVVARALTERRGRRSASESSSRRASSAGRTNLEARAERRASRSARARMAPLFPQHR